MVSNGSRDNTVGLNNNCRSKVDDFFMRPNISDISRKITKKITTKSGRPVHSSEVKNIIKTTTKKMQTN